MKDMPTTEYVLDNNSETKNEGENQKKTVPVKVGVGGLFITTIKVRSKEKECVLLYKRYKEPEIYQWSLPGGHVEPFQTCEDALKKKTVKRLHEMIAERDVNVLDVVTVVNHYHKPTQEEPNEYHYVSPQYYMDITETAFSNIRIDTGKKVEYKKDHIALLDSEKKLASTMGEEFRSCSTEESPWLALVPVDLIKSLEPEKLNSMFIQTTVQAIKQHLHILDNLKKIQDATKESLTRIQSVVEQIQSVVEQNGNAEKTYILPTVNSYKRWRSNTL